MSEMWCPPPPCRDNTRREIINLNHAVCSDCGVVHQTSSSSSDNWFTTFPNPIGIGIGIGDPSNPLPNGCLCSSSGDSLSHWPIRPDHQLITTMCDKLGLVATIKDRANEIYKKVEDLKSSRVRNQEAVLAACLYIACRQEDRPRTVKEICSVAGTTIKEVGRAKKFIVKQLQAEMGLAMEMGTITAGIFLSRFCSLLGMSNAATKAAQETAQKSGELDIRRSPISIAAAVIYMITQLSDEKKTIRDIMLATGVAELTIRNSYKDLYPHASMLIPTSFATEENLGRLSAP